MSAPSPAHGALSNTDRGQTWAAGSWPWRPGEASLFWAFALAQLIPIWVFRYLPTQDGPAHLGTAVILKDYGAPGTRYHEFMEVRLEPLPNWTSQLLLAGLMFVVPPLVAEKLLVSAYVLALAGGLRYVAGALGQRTRPLSLAGLLFVFNRCLWLGFYNFLFSLVLCWWVLGYWLRRAQVGISTALTLALLLVALFFTHLVGLLVAAAALAWLAVTARQQRGQKLGWVAVACLPAGLLALDYLWGSGFFRGDGATRLGDHAWHQLTQQGWWDWLAQDLARLDAELFARQSQGALIGSMALAMYAALAAVTILTRKTADAADQQPPPRWPLAVLAVVFAWGYLLAPQHVGAEHGGFLKARLALLPPLLLLACFREPVAPAGRLALRALIMVALIVNLILVTQRFAADSEDLAEYTAAGAVVGSGKVLFVSQDITPSTHNRGELADPLLHASHYYCLGTGNVNLDNYQAATRHFPLKFREGVSRGRGAFAWYERRQDVDVIVSWDAGQVEPPASFRSVFRRGRLEILSRRSE
jgi:hypothetical protein